MSPKNEDSRHQRKRAATRIAAALLVAGGLATTLSLTASASAQSHSTKRVTISAFISPKLGKILSDHTTLYTLRPGATACTASCHKIWIPVLLPKGVTKATAGAGVSASKLGTKKVTGGLQVTFGGRALFWFFEDTAAGQVNGNVTDKWGKWADVVLVKPTSKPTATTTVPTKPPTSTTTPPITTTTRPPTTTTQPVSGGGGGF